MHIDPEQQQNITRQLRSLPQETRQPYDWTEFRRRARERASAGARRSANGKKYAALAAALVLVIMGVAAWIRLTRPGMPVSAESDAISESDPMGLGPPDTVEARAANAERWLASLPDEPSVVRVGTRATIAGLEDRIAQLDDFLSAARAEGTQPARLTALEEQRARLVNSLVQVRYAETLVSASR
jgi:hypothetical protein